MALIALFLIACSGYISGDWLIGYKIESINPYAKKLLFIAVGIISGNLISGYEFAFMIELLIAMVVVFLICQKIGEKLADLRVTNLNK